MATIQIDDKKYYLPSSWDGLTMKQLRFLVRMTRKDTPVQQVKLYMLLYCMKARVVGEHRIYSHILRNRLGFKTEWYTLRIGRKKYRIRPESLCKMADTMDFLLTKEEGDVRPVPGTPYVDIAPDRYYIQPKMQDNPCPVLRCRLRRFTAPEDCTLSDLTFEQYIYLQTYLDAMQKDAAQIDYVLACVWHRGEGFEISRLESDAKLLHHLPADTKMVMYWFISSALRFIGGMFPRLFSGESKVGRGNVLDSQLRLLDSLAQHDMTKKDAVRRGLLMDALYSMDEMVRQQEEQEKKMQK